MDSSAQNMLRDLGRIVWVTATSATGVGFLVNAAIVLL
jgi:uroporphyrinogen-III synthase